MSTIKDVAKLASVSPGTVTRYLQNKHLKPETEQRVSAAVKELNFRVNPAARSLRSRQSYTVGVLTTYLTSGFVPLILEAVESFFNRHGYGVVVCFSLGDEKIEKNRLEFLIDKQVDGLIAIPGEQVFSLYRELIDKGIPLVTVDTFIDGLICDSVMINNSQATYEAVELLIQNGHRRIGVLVGPETYSTAQERLKGYIRALSDYGIEVDNELIWQNDYGIESGKSGTRHFLQMAKKVTAVLATNYHLTLGSLSVLNQLQVHIPSELSFIGFDAQDIAEIVQPNPHTIVQPIHDLGRKASEILLKRMQTGLVSEQIIHRLPTRLQVGGSVGKV